MDADGAAARACRGRFGAGGGNGSVALPTVLCLVFDECLTSGFAVIPARAGIQWFMSYIPTYAGMTTNASFRPA